MTRDEARSIEDALVETSEPAWRDASDQQRTPKRLRFTTKVELYCDGKPHNALNLRLELAAYLRRVAAYLEL